MDADVDILLLSLGTTRGLRAADAAFAELARAAGATVAVAGVRIGATAVLRRAYPVIDLVEALAARRALATAIARSRPRAVLFSTTTSALLAPRLQVPYGVLLDAPAALNRPGTINAPLHALERRSLAGARVVVPSSRAAAAALPAGSGPAVVLGPVVLASAAPAAAEPRERLAVAYTPDVKAKGLDVVCAAWAQAAAVLQTNGSGGAAGAPPERSGGIAASAPPEPSAAARGPRLEVFGVDPVRGRAFLAERGLTQPPGLVWRGMTSPAEFRSALRRARVFVAGARWEDLGLAPLEALADGALLATVPSAGPFEALALARSLAPELVAPAIAADGLARCITAAFGFDEQRLREYRRSAAELLRPFAPARAAQIVADEILPRLLAGT